ncbi:hypothetical protein SELMODRAFT_129957 [Selaginella moellendorffii]|uniref:Peroxidase n=1 Tax=Selaginella moellendorffii TaxID=88036 RepID=D8T1T8_SELML|nr:peroxidase 2 [Selaginella moellendorffii]EFJ09446.1 hypothetical protein SELMODRAFT_129957 [Selaginella moellendorffii]|eukprot:XP_002989570.1 peroxidase 2 [Selaginella moellendorffii]
MACKLLFVAFLALSLGDCALGALSSSFYATSCPNLTNIVHAAVQQVVASEPRMCASLIRLFFHDCHVNGCDASILLAGASLEQNAFPNINSVRGYDVVNNIKALIEAQCPRKVSCADELVLIAQQCVTALGGPSWSVLFGRRDSLNASQSAANTNLPPPTFNVSALIANFQAHGLSLQDMVALSGAHTVGKSHCSSFKRRLYGPFQAGDAMNPTFNTSLQSQCPNVSSSDNNLVDLDQLTPVVFDNKYFVDLLNGTGVLFSDETLAIGGNSTAESLVWTYASNQTRFFLDFVTGMINMGNESPLQAPNGQIRLNCSRVN